MLRDTTPGRGVTEAMAQTPRVPVNPLMLKWARERMDIDVEDAAQRLNTRPDRVVVWEHPGEKPDRDYPTIAQLRRLAALYRQTLAFFFRAEPPEPPAAERPPDFRRRGDDDRLPLRLLQEIDKAAERRSVYVDLAGPEPADLPYSDLADVAVAAMLMRNKLGITLRDQQRWKQDQALRHWVERAEALGVLVFQMSYVDPDECQGFSLFFDRAPVIVLNGADTTQVRTFTLAHELGHLMLRSGGVCHTQSHSAAEVRCNAFAAELLMPQGDFVLTFNRSAEPLAQIPALAGRYRVSWSAVAVRMRTLGYISQDVLDEQLAIAADIAREKREEQRRKAREKKSGPPHHMTQLRNLGPRYVYTVLDALDDERITPVDASYFLESKWSTIRGMEDDLLKRAADI